MPGPIAPPPEIGADTERCSPSSAWPSRLSWRPTPARFAGRASASLGQLTARPAVAGAPHARATDSRWTSSGPSTMPQDPGVRRELGQDEVLGDAGGAERLHGMVDHP